MDNFETTLINLRVLQSLECHSRLDTTERLFKIHVPAQWVPIFVKRWWASQNRLTDIARIQSLYQQALQCIENNTRAGAIRMQQYIENSKRGLKNLQTTYANDKTMVALIDVILDSIQLIEVTIVDT